MVNIMMIEADTAILQEVIMFLSGKGQCRITNLSLPEGNGCVLTFPGLEIHLNEQTVYRDGVLVPMTYHEFFTLAYLASHPGWVFSKAQIYEAVSAPVIKCKKTPRKKCRNMAERRKKR